MSTQGKFYGHATALVRHTMLQEVGRLKSLLGTDNAVTLKNIARIEGVAGAEAMKDEQLTTYIDLLHRSLPVHLQGIPASESIPAPSDATLTAQSEDGLREALDLLDILFTAYEDGPACYEDPDERAGYLGPAVRIDEETFHRCTDLLNRERPRNTPPAPDAAGRATPPPAAPEQADSASFSAAKQQQNTDSSPATRTNEGSTTAAPEPPLLNNPALDAQLKLSAAKAQACNAIIASSAQPWAPVTDDPQLPDYIVAAIRSYGDARADGEIGGIGVAVFGLTRAIRSWGGSILRSQGGVAQGVVVDVATLQRWSMQRGSDGKQWSVYMDRDDTGEWVKWTHVQTAALTAALAPQQTEGGR